MTHTVIQSPPMTPEQLLKASDKTHVRPTAPTNGYPWSWARILEHKPNDVGDVPVQFDDGGYGTIDLDAIGDEFEMYTPLLDAPTELWFIAAKHREPWSMYSLSFPPMPSGLRRGPYTTAQRDAYIADPEQTWTDDVVWRRYRLVEE